MKAIGTDLVTVVALQALVTLLVRRVSVAEGAAMRVRLLDRVGIRRRRLFDRRRRHRRRRRVAGVARPEHRRRRRRRRVLQKRD